MSPKRKRPADAEPNESNDATAQKRKKGRMSFKDKEKQLMEIHKGLALLDVLRNHKGQENRLVTEHFMRTPSRRVDSEYYKIIANPIDFTRIQQKLKTEEYLTFDECCNDIDLLIRNAHLYYKEGTEEHQDAEGISAIFIETKRKIENGEFALKENGFTSDGDDSRATSSGRADSSNLDDRDAESPEGVDVHMIEDIISGILEYTDSTGRLLCPPFRVLQSRDEFPSYYEMIKNPIDLKKIAENGRDGVYKKIKQLEDDLELLFKNAQKFSGSGTEIHRDSEVLLRFVHEKVAQVTEKGCHPRRKEKVRRAVDALLAQSPSAWASDDFSEDSEEDETTVDSKDLKWRLYWIVRNAKENTTSIAEPFLGLPSKTYYPDYYDEIKTPISLYMVNKKLKSGGYATFEDVFKDLMQMYENACEYNLDSSEVYIFAKRLEQLTVRSAKRLVPELDIGDFEKLLSPPQAPKLKTPKTVKPKIETDFDSDSDVMTPPASHKKKPRKPKGETTAPYPGKPGRKTMDELMLRFRQRLLGLWDVIYGDKTETYWPAGAFLELPSYRDYPDYYKVIESPVDMKTIRDRIESNAYSSSVELMTDFKLMFSNARIYNEPDSQIYRDANHLQTLVENAHSSMKDGPQESPLVLKQKLGWLKTKLPSKKKRQLKLNNGVAPFSSPSSFCPAVSDDESSNSPIRSSESPSVQRVLATTKKRSLPGDRKLEEVLAKLPEEEQKMWRLLNGVKDYRDEKGRRLSIAFMRLPTREEYPRYYDVIKKPMDLQRVQQRLNGQGYQLLSDIYADMTLMLDNACRYNEPESLIYKDAVSLQRVLLELKRELGTEECVPRVQVEIRTIFLSMFAGVFSTKDANERCLSDSFVELPDLLRSKGIPRSEWPFTFDQIKRNIDKCRYRRLDRFQKDFFDLFERAREVSRVGTTLFDDAVCLQMEFIKERDKKCKGVIVSDAYNVNEKDVEELVSKEKADRSNQRESEDKEVADKMEPSGPGAVKQDGEVDLETLDVGGVSYATPCYAYIARTDDKSKLPPHIMRVERIFKNENGDDAVYGWWVYRPNETLHLASRKFITNEVFITPFADTVLAERLLGRCVVVAVKTFVNNEVGDVPEKDVYVCEWRYHGKPKYFLKIKHWAYLAEDEKLKLTPRDRPLSPEKSTSELPDEPNDDEEGDMKSSSSSSDEDERLRSVVVLDIDRPEVKSKVGEADADGRMYFQQMRTKSGRCFCVGQFALVFNPCKSFCDVMRIDRLWRENDGAEWFSGGWFARPSEVAHYAGKMFYSKEVIAINQPDQTRRVMDIQSRCTVLLPKDYVRQRPTEIPECDVFVCETKVRGAPITNDETTSLFCKQSGGGANCVANGDENDESRTDEEPMNVEYAMTVRKLKAYKLSVEIPDDELFIFKSLIVMEKDMSPTLKNETTALDPLDEFLDDDTDGSESVISTSVTKSDVQAMASSPSSAWVNSQPKLNVKSKSGYILFSAEIRKRIMHENPDSGFGEVSKIVGIEWKKLSEDQKRQYEVRAEYIATERAKQEAVKAAQERTLQPGQQRIYQCKWANCDSQFDAESGLFEHIVQHHTSQIIMDSDQQFVCMWVSCLRNRKDGKPFPSLPRLHRHMKEKHLTTSMRNVYQNQIGRNFFKLVTATSASGEQSLQLMNVPYGRMPTAQAHHQQTQQPMNGAMNHHGQGGQPMNANAPQQMQTPMNGHQMPSHVQQQGQQQMSNGEHHYMGNQNPQQMMQQTAGSQNMYSAGPSCSQYQQVGQSQAGQMQMAQGSQIITDPGRTVVRAAHNAEPVFVAPPNSIHSRRVLHSEAYLKYIESLSSARQKSVSRWEKSVAPTHRLHPQSQNHPAANGSSMGRLPTHWIRECRGGKPVTREEDVTKALWRLREELLQSTCNVSVDGGSL